MPGKTGDLLILQMFSILCVMITLPPAPALQAKHLLSAQKESSDRLSTACHLKGRGENFVSGVKSSLRTMVEVRRGALNGAAIHLPALEELELTQVARDSGLHNIMKPSL